MTIGLCCTENAWVFAPAATVEGSGMGVKNPGVRIAECVNLSRMDQQNVNQCPGADCLHPCMSACYQPAADSTLGSWYWMGSGIRGAALRSL